MGLVYWFFLCGHNCGCCKRICGCCNQKGAWGGEQVARPLLALMFFVTLIIMCTSTSGAGHFKNGLTEVGDVLGKVADIFDKLEGSIADISSAGTTITNVGTLASVANYNGPNTGTGCRDKAAGEMYLDIGKSITEAATALKDIADGQGDKVRSIKKTLTEDGPPMLDAMVMATVALFVPWTLFGLIGVGLGSKAPRISDCFLNAVAALGLLILWIVAIMIAIELAIGVMFADFCFADPLESMATLVSMKFTKGDEKEKLMHFFLDCTGTVAGNRGLGNAFSPANADITSAELMSESLLVLSEGVSGSSCAASTMDMLTAAGTGAIPLCRDALATVKTQFSCENVNPLFVSLTHDAICTDAVSGLLSLFNTQVVAGVFMLFTLHYASFVRPYMNTKKATADQAAKVEPVDDVPADAQAQQEAPAPQGGPEQPESVEQSVPAPIEQKPAQPATDAASS